MNFEDIIKQQRRLDQLLGVDHTAKAIVEAHRAARLIHDVQPKLRKSVLDQMRIASGVLEGRSVAGQTIADYLREHGAALSGIAGGLGYRIGATQAAAELARRHQESVGALNDRIMRDLVGTGRLGSLASDGLGAVAAARAQAGAASRVASWAAGLGSIDHGALAGVLRSTSALDDQIGRLSRAAAEIATVGHLASRATAHGALPGQTTVKMAAFAGSIDMFGPGAPLGGAAFGSLLGEWRTRADLPPAFWRDRATRSRMYRDAEVDEGLVEAGSPEVVQALVESGVVEGARTPTGVKAVVEIGPLRLSITTGRARHGAFQVIDGFEVALRAFVATKLEAHLAAMGMDPNKWFTERVPGSIAGQAKRTRQDAYRAGEERQPLVNFTNLGDLITVITSTRNWDEVFGPVFGDRDGFKVDLQRLNAHRRPTMHARPMDGLRLAEIVLTVRRLLAAMERVGALDEGWDEDS